MNDKKDIAQLISDKANDFTYARGDVDPKFKDWLIANFTFIVSKGKKVEAHYQYSGHTIDNFPKFISDAIVEVAKEGLDKEGSNLLHKWIVSWLEKNFVFGSMPEAHYHPQDEIPDLKPGMLPDIKLSDEDTNPEILQAEVDYLRGKAEYFRTSNAHNSVYVSKLSVFIENLIQLQAE